MRATKSDYFSKFAGERAYRISSDLGFRGNLAAGNMELFLPRIVKALNETNYRPGTLIRINRYGQAAFDPIDQLCQDSFGTVEVNALEQPLFKEINILINLAKLFTPENQLTNRQLETLQEHLSGEWNKVPGLFTLAPRKVGELRLISRQFLAPIVRGEIFLQVAACTSSILDLRTLDFTFDPGGGKG